MEEKLSKVIRNLKVQFYLFWIIPILIVVLCETELLPVGAFADAPQLQFVLENIGILITILLIPVSLKLFGVVLKKKIDNVSLPVALNKYQLWSGIRLGLLALVVLYNLTLYYLTLNSIGGLCALIALTASLFCYPTEKRLREELHLTDDEE